MAMPNIKIMRRSAITTDDIKSYGNQFVLPVDEGEEFVDGVYEASETLSKVRNLKQRTPQKRINKMFIRQNMLRANGENAAPTEQKPVTFGSILLTPVKLGLAYELTQETIEDNLEMEEFEDHIGRLTEDQIARDLNKLLWRGDTTDFSGAASVINQIGGLVQAATAEVTLADTSAFPDTSAGFGFALIDNERISYESKNDGTNKLLNLTRGEDGTADVGHANGAAVTFVTDALLKAYDGVIVLVKANGAVVNPAGIGTGDVSLDLFHTMVDQIPNSFLDSSKYANQFRWFCNKKFIRRWDRYVSARMTGEGDKGLSAEEKKAPLGYGFHADESIPDGTVVFGPVKGIIHTMRTTGIRYVRTGEGKDLASRDAIYYKWSLRAFATLDDPTAFAIAEGVDMTLL